MEKFSDLDTPKPNVAEEKVESKTTLSKKVSKMVALGGAIGLGFFGHIKDANAGDNSLIDPNKVEQPEHHHPLGPAYSRISTAQKAEMMGRVARLREILVRKGVDVPNGVEVRAEEGPGGVPAKIFVGDKEVRVNDSDLTPEEIRLRGTMGQVSRKFNEIGNGAIPNKTVVSTDADEFLGTAPAPRETTIRVSKTSGGQDYVEMNKATRLKEAMANAMESVKDKDEHYRDQVRQQVREMVDDEFSAQQRLDALHGLKTEISPDSEHSLEK